MEGVLGGVVRLVLHKPNETPAARECDRQPDGTDLLAEMETVRLSLGAVTSRFNCTTDPDLLDSCIYEMQALSSRYRHLLRQARQMHLSRPLRLRSEG